MGALLSKVTQLIVAELSINTKFCYCKDYILTLQALLILTHLMYNMSELFHPIFSEKSFVILISHAINWKNKPGKHEHVTVLSSHTCNTGKPGIYFDLFFCSLGKVCSFLRWSLVNLGGWHVQMHTLERFIWQQYEGGWIWENKIGRPEHKLRDMATIQVRHTKA